MNSPKKYLIVCLSACTFYASTYNMEEDYNFTEQQTYNRHTMLRRVCTYTVIPITIAASTITAGILIYKWLNPAVDQAQEDMEKIKNFMNQAAPLLPQAQQLLSQGNNLLQQLNAMVPRADQLLYNAEDLYPEIKFALSSFLNITERLGQLFGN